MTPNPGTARRGGFTATSRQEFIADILIPNMNSQYMLPNNGGLIPNDRFMYGMWLIFEGRGTNSGANVPSGVRADHIVNLIQNVTISGYHRVRGQSEQFINVRGIDLYNLNRAYWNAVPFLEPSNGWPQFNPQLSIVGNEFNDIRFALYIPFTPMRVPINSQMGWLLDAPNYDRLQLQVTMGDATAVFQGLAVGGADVAWTAYGSAAGSPRIRVQGQFALGGTSVYGYVPARTWRYFQEITGSLATTTANTARLYNIPRGNKIRGILLKTGVQATTNLTAGLVAYDTVTDDALLNILIQRGLNKMIRFYPDFRSLKYEIQQSYGMYQQTGFALLDFAQRGRLTEALNTVGLVAGPSGDTDLYVQADVTGNANQAFLFLVEELRNIPRSIVLPGATAPSS
jgi:hypothetical protein